MKTTNQSFENLKNELRKPVKKLIDFKYIRELICFMVILISCCFVFEAETESIKWKKKYQEEHARFKEADSLRLIYSTYIVDDKKLHEGCLKAGSYGNHKSVTN